MAFFRPSFTQLMLAAFVVVGGLLGGAAVQALVSMESLMDQGREGNMQAIELSTAAQSLAEQTLAMERSARQSLVLRDQQLRQQFEDLAGQSRDVLARLEENELPSKTASAWRNQLEKAVAQLEGDEATMFERDQAVAQAFRDLGEHNAAITQQVQNIITNRNAALQTRLTNTQQRLTRLVLGAIVLAALLAIGSGLWLSRPFRRLEKAIIGLGENRLEHPIDIPGPHDVRQVGQQLEWLRLRLTELDADKARFLRHISHELKTPLASMHEGVAVLSDGVAGPLNPSQDEVVQILRHNTGELQSQIEALLRFNAAAFDARQLKRTPVDLLAMLESQVDSQRLRWQAKQLHVRVEGPSVTMPVDTEKLASAFGNLLSNAIRFSPVGGRIRLGILSLPGRVAIDVQDDGPGVSELDRQRIFEPFFRGERQPQDAVKGSGVGLSIVKEYINAHGGKIELLEGREGAHFRIELPHAN
ncbi:ATP-binding protein [Hydrogenophaga sp. 5NK40-0174]|uniref:sensor histidine kinase n=1 Tax=Hydrogenophaga sp. 5NK40-0174 TaxID=3127649 RepID=UPI003104AAC9